MRFVENSIEMFHFLLIDHQLLNIKYFSMAWPEEALLPRLRELAVGEFGFTRKIGAQVLLGLYD